MDAREVPKILCRIVGRHFTEPNRPGRGHVNHQTAGTSSGRAGPCAMVTTTSTHPLADTISIRANDSRFGMHVRDTSKCDRPHHSISRDLVVVCDLLSSVRDLSRLLSCTDQTAEAGWGYVSRHLVRSQVGLAIGLKGPSMGMGETSRNKPSDTVPPRGEGYIADTLWTQVQSQTNTRKMQ